MAKKKATKKKASNKTGGRKGSARKAGGKKTTKKASLPKITPQQMHDQFFQWKLDGYEVDDLEDKIDKKDGPKLFFDYKDKIGRLQAIEHDIASLNPKGFEHEINVISTRLKKPSSTDAVEKAYKDLRRRMKEKMFISMVHEGFKVIKKEEAPAPGSKKEEAKPAEKSEKAAEKESPADVAGKLEPGSCYLIEEPKPERSYQIFEALIDRKKKGVCVTREFPEKLREQYKLGESTIFWLSNTEARNSFKPVELGKLYYNLEEFLKNNKDTVIMLSGLEYLITQNNYSSVLKLIQLLNEQIAVQRSILIVPISPSTLEEKDLKLIERELTLIH